MATKIQATPTPGGVPCDTKPMIVSICGPLMNKVKICFQYPRKNIDLANNKDIRNLIFLLGEQLLPQWCQNNKDNFEEINTMHNLMYLFAYKTQQIFFSRVIHAIIDQNWDLKGFKQVFMRILSTLQVSANANGSSLEKQLDKLLASQNLQSTSCIKAIGCFLRNHKKPIDEDDLSNPIKTYQTDFEFIKEDIERFRQQNMNHECFQVLHPWAYELDSVDFKYIVNNSLAYDIQDKLGASIDAQVFWLSFFKPQKACAADEFFEALRQLCEINKTQDYFAQNEALYHQIMVQKDHVISIDRDADTIIDVIEKFTEEALNQNSYCSLQHQLRLYQTQFEGTVFCTQDSIGATYVIDNNPRLEYFKNEDNALGKLTLKDMPGKDINTPSLLQKREMVLRPTELPQKTLKLKFESVDTAELQNVEIKFEGDRGIFKVGEGEQNHYQIPNDKKLWETQFMIINKDGQYYIRDLGFVHTSRVKLDKRSEIQIQKGSIVDLGKVVHYHFDKATHQKVPTEEPSDQFYLMRPSDKAYDLDQDDYPQLRARPTWVSADENVDNIQNEINVCAENQKLVHSLGRSMKRDIQIKLKAVSADHCAISFSQEKGWTITERGKDRLSSNGTFIFMKSMQQMTNHVPSDMIPLHDEMIISFVNYELKVSLLQKTQVEMEAQSAAMEQFFAERGQNQTFVPQIQADRPDNAMPEATYTAEVQQNEEPAAAEQPEASEKPAAEGAEAAPAEGGAEPVRESTEEEFAQAATKIGAAFRGQKARKEVAEIRAKKEAEKAGDDEAQADEPAAAEGAEAPAEGEAKASEEAKPEEEKKE